MEKIDFKKQWKHLYRPSAKDFDLVEVPAMDFMMVAGEGDPNTSSAYQAALEALYALAYKVKFISKSRYERDYVIPPLEGLWWADDMDVFTTQLDKDQWKWTMMIMIPEWIESEVLDEARKEVEAAKSPPALPLLRVESYDEGLCVQIMHLGSYDEEGPTLHRLHHEYLPEHSLQPSGLHHEIYLSDPRKLAIEKLRTVLRQPVTRQADA
jgi:hypothetical protein